MRKSKVGLQWHEALALCASTLSACGGGGGSSRPEPIYLEPTPIATALAFDRVVQGYDSSCMLTPDGQAWCWGNNEYGQLGAPTAKSCQGGFVACTWQAVRTQPTLRFASLSLSRLHGCALDAAGQAWCWGLGQGGQLGDGRSADSATPVAVAGNHRFVRLSAGTEGLLTCALDDAGNAWCWGPGDSGGLGNGTTDGAAAPVQVLAAQPLTSIGVGSNHACGLDASGQAWCWGRNPYGTLGRGVSGASLLPAPVTGGHRFVSLTVGGNVSCGLDADGAAWCWGFGPSLGDGTLAHSDVPVAVAGGHAYSTVSAGYQHVCALTADGSAWCWGPAMLTGSGSATESKVPTAVAGGHRFRVLQAGGTASCGITLSGQPLCWGLNHNGAVGQDNLAP